MDVYQHHIAGRWSASVKTLDVINLCDGTKMAEISHGGVSEIDAAGMVAQALSQSILTPIAARTRSLIATLHAGDDILRRSAHRCHGAGHGRE